MEETFDFVKTNHISNQTNSNSTLKNRLDCLLDRSPHCGSGDCVAVKGGLPSVKQSVGSTLLRHQELAKDIKYILLARIPTLQHIVI